MWHYANGVGIGDQARIYFAWKARLNDLLHTEAKVDNPEKVPK